MFSNGTECSFLYSITDTSAHLNVPASPALKAQTEKALSEAKKSGSTRDSVPMFLPTGKLADSTVKGYKDSWRCHIRDRVEGRVRDFRTVDGENIMCEIETAHKSKTYDSAHDTYKHIKVTLSAIFTFAKRKGVYEGVNPMTGVTIPKGKKHGRKRLAYTLEEVEKDLELFSGTEPIVISTEYAPYAPSITQSVVRAVISCICWSQRGGSPRSVVGRRRWGGSQHPAFGLEDSS
jgi:hypothetical protein